MQLISNHLEPKLLQSYQLFYEDSPTPFLIRENNTWLYANAAALNLLGIKQMSDFIGTEVSDWIVQEKTVMEKWIYLQKIVTIDLFWKTTHGKEIYLETHNIPIVESPNMFQVFIRKNLTTNHNQRLNDIKLKLIADYTTEMVGELDLTGKFIYISPSYQEITGYIPELAIGENPFDLIHPSERESVFERFLQIIHNSEILTVECKFLHARNDYIWLETHFIPVVEDEKVKHVTVVSRDITKRKEAEEKLRKSEAQHRIILEHSNDLICVVTTEGIYEYASPSYKFILGYEPKDIVGKNVFSFMHDEDIPKFKEYLSLLEKKKNNYFTLTFRKININGQEVFFEGKGMSVEAPNGEIEKYVFISRDISEKLKTEEYVRNNEKLAVLGQLAAGIAHEIRNPLTSIKGFVELIEENNTLPAIQSYCRIINDELNRLEQIVSEFMILGKPQILKMEKNINLHQLLKETIFILTPQATLYNVELIHNTSSEEIYMNGEPNLLKQAFMNIIKNAIEALPKGGKVVISAEIQDESCIIYFEDNGIGIEEDRLQNIGVPFYSNKEKGMGLGLTITNRIITQHKGKMIFNSKLNEGTLVKIILPLTNE
ncbi:hypothetical protein C0966_16620 [Bacillus methanolicus]|uniref:PAS domain S-box protein n=1 Tax=Bacillus methanolicus TaxID=1471 RepID=UPI00238080B5|nr:PAS domain S-box protein [Bacillus methanolicus]MDE3840896.1 hypothetical protein [Bacillus methanolicus]